MATIKINSYRCERCGHQWVTRPFDSPPPNMCARCKSRYWDVPPIRKAKKRCNCKK